MSQNWWRYEDINKVSSSYRTFDKMLNISVSFQPIDMLLGYIWRDNWGAQKTSLSAVFSFEILKDQDCSLLKRPVLVRFFSGLGLVLRLDLQALLSLPSAYEDWGYWWWIAHVRWWGKAFSVILLLWDTENKFLNGYIWLQMDGRIPTCSLRYMCQ